MRHLDCNISRVRRARVTFSKMSEALAVQTNGSRPEYREFRKPAPVPAKSFDAAAAARSEALVIHRKNKNSLKTKTHFGLKQQTRNAKFRTSEGARHKIDHLSGLLLSHRAAKRDVSYFPLLSVSGLLLFNAILDQFHFWMLVQIIGPPLRTTRRLSLNS